MKGPEAGWGTWLPARASANQAPTALLTQDAATPDQSYRIGFCLPGSAWGRWRTSPELCGKLNQPLDWDILGPQHGSL